MQHDYLREEFILISSKVDARWPQAGRFKQLISERHSLDHLFTRICVPVLLTYESDTVAEHKTVSDKYREQLVEESERIHQQFSGKALPPLRIHLFLFPLANKKRLVSAMHRKLEGLQR